jgi:hypothetical protein
MSDDEQQNTGDEQQNAGESSAPEPTQGRPSPSAQAARRARRIGGRPASGGPAEQPSPPAADSPVGQPVPARPAPAHEFPPGPPEAFRGAAAVGPPATPAWLNWLPAEVLAAGAVVMAVIIVIFSHGVWWGPDASRTPGGGATLRQQVLAAAKTCVANTNTYKYTDLDTYESAALKCATGKFRDDLKRTIDTLIKVNAPKLKSSQTAQINRGGIEAVSPDGRQWTILLYGQLSVTNSESTTPHVDPFAAQVRMDKVKDGWLISALTTVATPLS